MMSSWEPGTLVVSTQTESMTTLVQVDSGAELSGEAGCATTEGMTVFLGACGPLEFPHSTFQS